MAAILITNVADLECPGARVRKGFDVAVVILYTNAKRPSKALPFKELPFKELPFKELPFKEKSIPG